ncbi:MAG: GNAT family N-acetyltransferase, partial [Rubrivivax sp.]
MLAPQTPIIGTPPAPPFHWKVSLQPIEDRLALESEWRTLEQRSFASFFLSWDWVGVLLDNVHGRGAPRVLRIKAGSELKGLALLWSSEQRRQHGLIRSRSLHLNETGCPEFDRITMEHNGILTAAGDEKNALSAAIHHLATAPNWDECFLSGLDEALARHVDETMPLRQLWHHRRWTKRYHFVDLDAVRQSGGDYLDSLSNTSRYQARRALKGYAAAGPLQCRRATSAQEALDWLEDLMRLHQAHWNDRGQPGAFSSDFTRRFHT